MHSTSPTIRADDAAAPVSRAGPARILLAEDHDPSRDALRLLLESHGFEVLPATNGREAVDLALREPIDLVLLDIMMPELDGFQVARQLREHPHTCAVPILVLTAMDGAYLPAQLAGCNEVLRKPVDIRTLVARIRLWLARVD